MSDLTEDELSVLMIAAQGQSMIPIGRWEVPIKSLAAKGLLHANDSVNYVVTNKGMTTVAEADDDSFRGMVETSAKIKNAQTQAQMSVEQAALHLSHAAKASALVTGDAPEVALMEWTKVARERALALLRENR